MIEARDPVVPFSVVTRGTIESFGRRVWANARRGAWAGSPTGKTIDRRPASLTQARVTEAGEVIELTHDQLSRSSNDAEISEILMRDFIFAGWSWWRRTSATSC